MEHVGSYSRNELYTIIIFCDIYVCDIIIVRDEKPIAKVVHKVIRCNKYKK